MWLVIVPWGVALVIWGFLALMCICMAAGILIVGIVLIPFRIGLSIVSLALHVLLFPLTMLAGRR